MPAEAFRRVIPNHGGRGTVVVFRSFLFRASGELSNFNRVGLARGVRGRWWLERPQRPLMSPDSLDGIVAEINRLARSLDRQSGLDVERTELKKILCFLLPR
jgi:hypothetical protein